MKKNNNFLPVSIEDYSNFLECFHQKYNPKLKMLKQPLSLGSSSVPVYIQNISVHPTRESLEYALALLDTKKPELKKRAIAIIEQIIRLQNQDYNSNNYGTWPKYLEYKIPFTKGKFFKPDYNWAEFISMILLLIIVDHAHVINFNLTRKIEYSVLHATRLIQDRKVEVWYTNIFVKRIYIALIAGERYQKSILYEFGLEQLHKIYEFTIKNGGFGEYNSPNYNIVTLKVLNYLLLHLHDSKHKSQIEYLHRVAWQEIAFYFHSPTRQWAGPHSRTLTTLLKKSTLALIDKSTSNKVDLETKNSDLTLDMHRLSLRCPPDLEHFFLPITKPRFITQSLNCYKPQKILTAYITPAFSLSTVNYGDFWIQRRSLLAYWGTYSNPHYLHLRSLCDGIDFSAAQFFSIQQKENVLAGINFATDINGINPYLAKAYNKDYLFTAKDIRIRLEFGNIDNIKDIQLILPKKIKSPTILCYKNVCFTIAIPFAIFGDYCINWEVKYEKYKVNLDLILFSSFRKKRFGLANLEKAVVGLCLQVNNQKQIFQEAQAVNDKDTLKMTWQNLFIEIADKPNKVSNLYQIFNCFKD